MRGQSAVVLRGLVVFLVRIHVAHVGELHRIFVGVSLVGDEDEGFSRVVHVRKVDLVVRGICDDDVLRYAAEPHIEAVGEVRIEQTVHAFVEGVAGEIDPEHAAEHALYCRPQRVDGFPEREVLEGHVEGGAFGDGLIQDLFHGLVKLQAEKHF